MKALNAAFGELTEEDLTTVTFTAEEIVEEEPETNFVQKLVETIVSAVKHFFNRLFGWL